MRDGMRAPPLPAGTRVVHPGGVGRAPQVAMLIRPSRRAPATLSVHVEDSRRVYVISSRISRTLRRRARRVDPSDGSRAAAASTLLAHHART